MDVYFVNGFDPENLVSNDELGSDDWLFARYPNIVLGKGSILEITSYMAMVSNRRVTRTFKGIISATRLFSAATYTASNQVYVRVKENTPYATIKSKIISLGQNSGYDAGYNPLNIKIMKLVNVSYSSISIVNRGQASGSASGW